ncbi:MAG: aminotransferase class V-fold PLP-dependent enzyme [Acidobacteriota bacterium]|nr:aminotransferase class V-fold PLP-dependent enzyme [Acidobacteriota bacterium]
MDETNPQIEKWRADTPGAAHRIHLNNAGAGLMPRPVFEAVTAHLEREANVGGYEAAEDAAEGVAASYRAVAELLGAQPRNVAVVENATVAFSQALSAFDFRPGDTILTSQNDYISNQLMYLSLARRTGVEVVRAADLPEGGVDPESIRGLLGPRVKLVALTWVPTNSGLVQPVEAVGEICEAAGVPYLVDACQAAGQIPIDVARLRCDFLSATARKFLRGPRGIGFLYVSDRALERGAYPLLVDMRGARWVSADRFELVEDARRFENWEFAYALVHGLGAAARYALEAGVEECGRRARRLAGLCREKLAGAGEGLRVLDRGPELCAIVTVEVRGRDARDVVLSLRRRGINTSASLRAYAVIDMAQKHAASAVRISPHYYNTENEIDAVVEALVEEAETASRPPLGKNKQKVQP